MVIAAAALAQDTGPRAQGGLPAGAGEAPDLGTRVSAAIRAAGEGDASSVPVLLEALGDEAIGRRELWGECLEALELLDNHQGVKMMAAAARPPGSRMKRTSAIDALAGSADPAATDALVAVLDDPLPGIRAHAAEAIARRGAEGVTPGLKKQMENPDPWVRIHVAGALLGAGDKDAEKLLTDSCSAPGPEIRIESACILASAGIPGAVQVLTRELRENDDQYYRADAARCLVKLHLESTITDLAAALEDPSRLVRAFAAEALGLIGTEEARRALQGSSGKEDVPLPPAERPQTVPEVPRVPGDIPDPGRPVDAVSVRGRLAPGEKLEIDSWVVLHEVSVGAQKLPDGVNFDIFTVDGAGKPLYRLRYLVKLWEKGPAGFPFEAVLPLPDRAAAVVFSYREKVILKVNRSRSEPRVHITGIRDGQLAWSASDPDGDELLYMLLLRRAGEQAPIAIVGGLESSSFDVGLLLPETGSGNYFATVIASDGFNDTSTTSALMAAKNGEVIRYGSSRVSSGR